MTYNPTRDALIEYLHRKVAEQDWPAVSDAANDLSIFEILEARAAPRIRQSQAAQAQTAKN